MGNAVSTRDIGALFLNTQPFDEPIHVPIQSQCPSGFYVIDV